MQLLRFIFIVSFAVYTSSNPVENKDVMEKLINPKYVVITNLMSAFEAIHECQKIGGRLLAIEDPLKENALIVYLRTQGIQYGWTSGIEKGGEFIWATTNGKVQHENWGAGYPQPGKGCIFMTEDSAGDFYWEQDYCGNPKFGICEL